MSNRPPITDYERFESSSDRNRRLLRQEELIIGITEKFASTMAADSVSQTELARRLGKTKSFVSQILAGDRNLTLRTISDVCDALGYRPEFELAAKVSNQNLVLEMVGLLWERFSAQQLFAHDPSRSKIVQSPPDEMRIAA